MLTRNDAIRKVMTGARYAPKPTPVTANAIAPTIEPKKPVRLVPTIPSTKPANHNHNHTPIKILNRITKMIPPDASFLAGAETHVVLVFFFLRISPKVVAASSL